MKLTIVPLLICFVFGWLAGWFGHWLWVDIGKREKRQKLSRRDHEDVS